MRALFLFCLIICWRPTNLSSQSKFNRTLDNGLEIEPHAFSLQIGGFSSFIGLTYSRLLDDDWSFDTGVGFIGVGAGISCYPYSIMKGRPTLYLSTRTFAYKYQWEPSSFIRHCLSAGIICYGWNKIKIKTGLGICYAHKPNTLRYYFPKSIGFPIYVSYELSIGFMCSFKAQKKRQ